MDDKLNFFTSLFRTADKFAYPEPRIRLSFYFTTSDHHTEFPVDVERETLASQLIDLGNFILRGK